MGKRVKGSKIKKTCSLCDGPLEERRVGKYRYCLACHAEKMRLGRPKHSELTEEERKKIKARSYLQVYVKRGIIEKIPCQICGENKSEGHHFDYDYPLNVLWLCREHHLLLHKNNFLTQSPTK